MLTGLLLLCNRTWNLGLWYFQNFYFLCLLMFRIVLAVLFFNFYFCLRFVLFSCMCDSILNLKLFFKFLWIIVLGILWSLYWTCTLILVEWPFLTILILTINEQRRSFHLLVSLQFILLSVLRFSLYKSFTCDFYFYFIFIPRYMLIWLWLVLFP